MRHTTTGGFTSGAEPRHRVAQKVVDTFRTKVMATHTDLFTYPLSFEALTVMISETYPIAVKEIDQLNIHKVARIITELGGSIETRVLDEYVALAGFLYARRGGGLIFIEQQDTEQRRKFTLAHELGHFINEYYEPVYLKYEANNTLPLFSEEGTQQTQQVVAARCSPADIYGEHEAIVQDAPDPSVKELVEALHREQKSRFNETRANLFAAELLMPIEECARLMSRCAREGLDPVPQLMRYFGVSRQAASVRAQELHPCRREKELFDP